MLEELSTRELRKRLSIFGKFQMLDAETQRIEKELRRRNQASK